MATDSAACPEVLLNRFELGRLYDGHALTFLTTDDQEVVLRLATPQEALKMTADALAADWGWAHDRLCRARVASVR